MMGRAGVNDDYHNEFLEQVEDWLAEMDTARRRLLDLELRVRALAAREVLSAQELTEILDALETIYVANARGRQSAKWLRRYPPDFGRKWPPDR